MVSIAHNPLCLHQSALVVSVVGAGCKGPVKLARAFFFLAFLLGRRWALALLLVGMVSSSRKHGTSLWSVSASPLASWAWELVLSSAW